MRNNRVLIIFIIALYLKFSACSLGDPFGDKITFTKVVGQYVGQSTTCEPFSASPDSICAPQEPNNLKVILYDLNTIIIEDTKNLFNKSRLTHDETLAGTNRFVHLFSSKDSTNTSLSFDESSMKVKLSRSDTLAGYKKIIIFNGSKI